MPKGAERGDRRRGANVDDEPAARPPRRWRRWWLAALVLLAALWLAPWIVAKSGLVNPLLARLAPIKGRLTVGSASLGWLSPIEAQQVALVDRRGQPVAEIAAVKLDKSLAGLLLRPSELGQIVVQRPVVHVVAHESGTNLHDALEPWLRPKKEKSPPPNVTVELRDGTLQIQDQMRRQTHELKNVNLLARLSDQAPLPLQVEASGSVASARPAAGFKVLLRGETASGAAGRGEVNVDLDRLPLDLVAPLLRSSLPGVQLAGRVSAKLTGSWGGDGPQRGSQVSGELVGAGLAVACNALGSDRLELAEVRIPCQLNVSAETLDVVRLELDCELARVSLTGRARLDELASAGWLRQAYELKGEVDLAGLANRLPSALRLKADTELTDGTVRLALSSRQQPNRHTWNGSLSTTNLKARSGGRSVEWRQPLTVSFSLGDGAQGPVLEQARCESSFLTVDAAGNLDELAADARFDLSRLAQELSQFVDLGEFDLAGDGRAELRWKRSPQGAFTLDGRLAAQQFRLAAPGRHPWTEAGLTADLQAQGQSAGGALARLDQARLQVQTQRDLLRASLAEAVADPARQPCRLAVEWRGQVATWLPRVQPWLDVSAWNAAGEGTLSATVAYQPGSLEVQGAKLDLAHFRAWNSALWIDEPQVSVACEGRYSAERQALKLSGGQLAAGSLRVNLDEAVISAGSDATSAALSYQADLRQIARWLQDPRQAPAWSMAGRLNGRVEAARRGEGIQAEWRSAIEQFEFASLSPAAAPAGPRTVRVRPAAASAPSAWREPRITLDARALYDPASGTARIDRAELTSTALRCRLTGTLRAAAEGEINVEGQIDYDWDQLAPLWRASLGDAVRVTGKQSRPFQLRGPLQSASGTTAARLAALSGEASIGWTSADLFGLQVGGGEVAARLESGRINVRPIDLAVNQGRVTLAPHVRLVPEPAVLELPRGQVVSQVRITPEMCARGLKYVLPVLADAVTAEGRWSLDLDGGRLPLADLKSGDLGGRLQVHTAEVRPGPLAQELIVLGRQIEAIGKRQPPRSDRLPETLLTIKDQRVEFRMLQGRVHHRNFEFRAGNVPVRTSGSVGLDESLDLVAEVTLPDTLGTKVPALAGLRGQSIQLAIGGTIQHPKLDDQAIRKLTRQALGNTAKGLLFDQLNKQLDKILPAEPRQ